MKILIFQPLILLLLCFCHTSRSYSVDPGWAKKKADIFFCVDTSSSVYVFNFNYKKQLQFVADLVSRMDIGPNYTRVGVGLYSEDLHLHIPLNNTLSKDKLISAITDAPHHGGNGYISRGLSGMMTKGLAPTLRRPDIPHISVLFTDDDARDIQIAMDNANLAKRQGIFLTTIAIGNRVNVARLGDYTSDPKPEFLYHVSDYSYLVSILPKVSKKVSEVEALAIDQGVCGNNKFVDVVFVFDEAALGKKVSNKIKEFLQKITENLSLNSGKVRVGVVSKTRHEEGDITLVQNLKREQLIEKLKADKGEEIGYLIKITIRDSFTTENGARQGSLKRLVVFLDDTLREKREIYGQLAKAKRDKYEIFVFYLGASYDQNFIESLGTNKEHVIFLGSSDELIPRKNEFMTTFCKNI
ncbi:unnamed protein product [Lymnaea stagnalis]|uniref:VWFA domain-containing protein n=1 Tax=Lymnaea stagnalis TaxID=6523 RepID=A0AAV2HXM9_LYMST